VVIGMAVVFFMCMGMTFVPLAFGMMRNQQPMYYPPMPGGENGPAYPLMPYGGGMWGGDRMGHGVLLALPMLACVVLPVIGLVFAGLHLARRHAWSAAESGAPVPPWMRKHWKHHRRHYERMRRHFAEYFDEGPDADVADAPAEEEAAA
jgi:hypothetical protein